MEALSAGRPVLATDSTPAVHELLDSPDAGTVVPIGDPNYVYMRGNIAIPPASTIPLDGFFGLHPALNNFSGIYNARPAVCREFPLTKRCAYWDLYQFEKDQQDDPDTLPLVKITFRNGKK